jgi:hypothetical protein
MRENDRTVSIFVPLGILVLALAGVAFVAWAVFAP